jgi:putative heme-binding domain-containing protein
LLCGSDDEIAVWLNGVKVHDSGVVSRSFGEDQDQAKLHFVAGRNALLVKIGNLGSAWEFAVRIPGLEGATFKPSKELSPDEKQRAFALATKPDGSWLNTGDAKRGEKLFYDKEAALSGICATCHAVRGKGGAIGPDLSAIAVNYRRPELVVSILEPSKTIALGFEQSIVETKAGETLVGALRQETNDTLTLVGADGQPHVVKKGRREIAQAARAVAHAARPHARAQARGLRGSARVSRDAEISRAHESQICRRLLRGDRSDSFRRRDSISFKKLPKE